MSDLSREAYEKHKESWDSQGWKLGSFEDWKISQSQMLSSPALRVKPKETEPETVGPVATFFWTWVGKIYGTIFGLGTVIFIFTAPFALVCWIIAKVLGTAFIPTLITISVGIAVLVLACLLLNFVWWLITSSIKSLLMDILPSPEDWSRKSRKG